jgi:hypothetical protein
MLRRHNRGFVHSTLSLCRLVFGECRRRCMRVRNVRPDYSGTGSSIDGNQMTAQKKERTTVSWADVVSMPTIAEARGRISST